MGSRGTRRDGRSGLTAGTAAEAGVGKGTLIPGFDSSDFAGGDFDAHALLAAVRADLVDHLAGRRNIPRERLRDDLAAFTTKVLNGPYASEPTPPTAHSR